MQRRAFGNSGFDVSVLGFGCMRLPVIGGEESNIDEREATRMLHCAIDSGVDYVDTAYIYHGGNSESWLGRAISGGLRDKVKIATKCPVWLLKRREDFDKYLDEQLSRLGVDHIDVYLLHSLDRRWWRKAQEYEALDSMDRAIESGKVIFPGFSAHTTLDVFTDILEAYEWSMFQVQFNYVDRHAQAGLEGIKRGAAKGMACVVMEPLRGGKLVQTSIPEVREIWASLAKGRTPAEWGLRWVLNHAEVSTVLSGMSSMEQVQENVRVCRDATANSLSESELAMIDQITDVLNARIKAPCTMCSYCLPCPNRVLIPQILDLFNDYHVYGAGRTREYYLSFEKAGRGVSACTKCGQCETTCPQKLGIMDLLAQAHSDLAEPI